jgi:HKD family nuclease
MIAAGSAGQEIMHVEFIKTSGIKTSLLRLMAEYDEFYWSVAWGSDGEMADHLLDHQRKIRQIIFGTHFCQTDPDLLERLKNCGGARIARQTGKGTFHPKVFGFASRDKRAAIIGSANFTNAGVGDNVEAALCVEAHTSAARLSTSRRKVR